MSRTVHNLPENLNPADDICYPLFVPDDPQWKQYLIRAIRTLTFDRHWERDENDGVDTMTVRSRWHTSTYLPLIDALQNSTTCGEGEIGDCYRAETTSEVFKFYPNDPFTDERDPSAPSGLISGLKLLQWRDPNVEKSDIWKAIEDVFGFITGYRDSDIIVFPDPEPLTTPIFQPKKLAEIISTLFNPFPYALIEIEGDGQIEIELVNVPLGGAALIVPDAPSDLNEVVELIVDFFDNDGTLPATWILAELDRDLSPPIPELAVTQTQEIEFTEAGSHTVHVFFIPEIIPIPPFIRFSGGIREIEFCGNIQVIGQQTGNKYDEISIADRTSIRGGVSTLMTAQEICDGVLCAFEEMSSRILLAMNYQNVRGSVDIEKQTDGSTNVTIEEAVRELFTNAPKVAADDIIYGGLLIVEEKMTGLHSDIVTAHADGMSDQQTADFLNSKYNLIEADTLAVVQAYFSELALSNPTFGNFVGFADYSFCDSQSRSDLVGFVFSSVAAGTIRNNAIDLCDLITFEQFNDWFERGKKTPNGGYVTTPCYTLPTQTHVLEPSDIWLSGGGWVGQPIPVFDEYPGQPAGEKYLITMRGNFFNSNLGRYCNWLYHQDGSGNYINNGTLSRVSGVGKAFDAYPANRQDGNYDAYLTTNSAGQVTGFSFTTFPTGWDLDFVSGSITFELINLGSA